MTVIKFIEFATKEGINRILELMTFKSFNNWVNDISSD